MLNVLKLYFEATDPVVMSKSQTSCPVHVSEVNVKELFLCINSSYIRL
jgi:hypothetical protein